MSSIQIIQRVLGTRLLSPELTVIPPKGATPDEIAEEERALGRSLSAQHRDLLSQWNGLNLDVIRIHGCGRGLSEIQRLSDCAQSSLPQLEGAIPIGSDPAGFIYYEDGEGQIHSIDTDGGSVKLLAPSLDAFLSQSVFGSKAASFGGEDWLKELREAGLLG